MMDFFTRFLRSNQPKLAKMLVLRVMACALFVLGFAQIAQAVGPEGGAAINTIQVERADGAIYLNAQLKFDLPPAVEDVLTKGIPLIFVADAEVRRDRWYWYDKKLVVATRQMRLAYQPLTRRWRLNVSNSFGGNGSSGGLGGSLGSGLPQYFDTLAEALSKVQRINRWRIVDLGDLDPDTLHTLELSFRLDVSQLPRPFQIGLIGQNDWDITASRSIRFATEVSK
jgi:Domain of unknown function (DUF4390)